MFKYNRNIEKSNNQLNTIVSFFIIIISLLFHAFTFIQFSNFICSNFIVSIIFFSILVFFSVSSFSLYFDLDILLILKLRLIFFFILDFFCDLVFFEIFFSFIMLAITFYIKPQHLDINNKKKFILPIILNLIIIFLTVYFFRNNFILFMLFGICNIFHLYLPILSKKFLTLFNIQNLPKNLNEYYILEFSQKYVPITSWMIPFIALFTFYSCNIFTFALCIISSIFCLIYDFYILYISYFEKLIFSFLFQIIIKMSLMTGLYLIYIKG